MEKEENDLFEYKRLSIHTILEVSKGFYFHNGSIACRCLVSQEDHHILNYEILKQFNMLAVKTFSFLFL